MSENGNGAERVTLPLDALIDTLVLTFDRRDGSLNVGGKTINVEVALSMCERAARYLETQLRILAAQQAQQNAAEAARVQALLERSRDRRS